MHIRISATVDDTQISAKDKLQVSWRYLIGKGIEHCEKCTPREELLREQYGQALKHRKYARVMFYLKDKFPEVWEQILKEDVM